MESWIPPRRGWRQELQYAAVGVAVAAALELVARPPRSRWQTLAPLLLAGGLAAAYTHLVPQTAWNMRSGASFAQLPPVVGAHASLAETPTLQLAAWGALTGGILRLLAGS